MILTWDEFTPDFTREVVSRSKYKYFFRQFVALDTETSHNHDEENPVGWIYQWAFRVDETRVIGRKPSEFIEALRKIETYLEDNPHDAKMIIYVHNLSYDLGYLKDFLIQEYPDFKLLALKPHKFISFTCGIFEFRCSWKLANRSLDKWSKDLGTEARKLIGTVDYTKIRYQDSELTATDWAYMLGDIDVLYECIVAQMKLYKDSIARIPLTATGYIRREGRKHFKKDLRNRKKFLATRLDVNTYILLLREFSGGLSHGNRFLAGKTLEGNIKHRDFVSHYPSQQRTQYFPIGKFNLYCRHADYDKVMSLTSEYCCLCVVTFHNLHFRDKRVTMPYLSESKAKEGAIGTIHTISDNGRILELSGYTQLVLTEIDLEWIFKHYAPDEYDVEEVYTSSKGFLPKFMIDTVDEFFLGKTKYKTLEKAEKDPAKKKDYKLSLMKSKNGLNGIYGMTAQKIVREEVEMDANGIFLPPKFPTKEEMEEGLDKYYSSSKSFMRYAWGCWTTSHARGDLLTFCEVIGYDKVIYCDTDSAFYFSDEETEKRIEAYNEELCQDSMKKGAFINYEGKIVHYNKFDLEDEDITKFRFLHSKCYAYEEGGVLHCTIAGVVPEIIDHLDEEGKPVFFTREEELGSIDNLKEDFVFVRCGGTKAKYIDSPPFTYEHNGHILECASSCIITETTKTLRDFITQAEIFSEMDLE